MTDAADQLSVTTLARIGRLLDEAIDIADRSGETLLSAQIAQVLHSLDTRVATMRLDPFTRDPGGTDPSGGGVVKG